MNDEHSKLHPRGMTAAMDGLIGVVYKKTKGSLLVRCEDQILSCPTPASRRPEDVRSERVKGRKNGFPAAGRAESEDPVVGDRVRFVPTHPGAGRILEILPRQNRLARRAAVPMPSAYAGEQLIAANIDQVIPVFAVASPDPKWNMLDRYLVSAEAAGVHAVICITKIDLEPADEEMEDVIADYARIGYPVIPVSVQTGAGVAEMREAMQGRISVLVGKSGTGKTSLLNAIEPGLGLRVSEVSQITGKGRHTTTAQEMFSLTAGGAVIDTPGVREFGLWDVAGSDLASLFPEMLPWIGQCRFGAGCRHDEEPGCAVRKAAASGAVSPRRYWSYLRLREETGGGQPWTG